MACNSYNLVVKKMKKILAIIGIFTTIILLIFYSLDIKEALQQTIITCGKSIIPSLFPICCICMIIVNSGFISTMPNKLILPFTFLISMVAGYPVGAKMLNTMVEKNIIKKEDAEKVLPSMICPGPAFAISIVGIQIFSSEKLGIIIYLSLLICNTILFAILGGTKIKCKSENKLENPFKAFINSAKSASESIIMICAYIIFFSTISTVIKNLIGSKASTIFLYFFEITGGVYSSKNIYLTCTILAFGGLCVMCQVVSVSSAINPSIKKITFFRLISSIISLIIMKLLMTIFPISILTISNIDSFTLSSKNDDIYVSIVFLFSLIVLLSSLSTKVLHKVYK